jgi:hypothetical protein
MLYGFCCIALLFIYLAEHVEALGVDVAMLVSPICYFLISPFNINVIYFPVLFFKNKSHRTFLAPFYPFMNYY